MKTTRNIILALALFLAFAGTALAMNHGKGADLTPEKQAVVDKAHDDFAAATADLKRLIFAKESALNAELYGEKTDDKKVEALVEEINALHGKIYAEKVKMQKIMAKEGVMPSMGHGMMGGGGCPMMSGKGMGGGMGMMGGKGMMGGMQHGADNGTAGQAPVDHNAHTPAKQ
jgi:zinc resistance-associated protein